MVCLGLVTVGCMPAVLDAKLLPLILANARPEPREEKAYVAANLFGRVGSV